jgi:hypothetical protein
VILSSSNAELWMDFLKIIISFGITVTAEAKPTHLS